MANRSTGEAGRLGARLYALLLHLYPAAFRAEYGDDLRALFARQRRDARSPGAFAMLWIATIADVVASAIQTHWDIARQDVRYALRGLVRSPGFTATALLVAGLGIGATTAVFSVTDHVLLRPLPFPDASRLVNLWEDRYTEAYTRTELSPPNYFDCQRLSTSFDTMAAYRGLSVNLIGDGTPERLEGASATAALFPMLGAHTVLGRLFSAAEDRGGAPGTLILSHQLWTQRFGADPGVIGRTLRLDDELFTIIGVMSPDFYFPRRDVMLWTPMRFSSEDLANRGNHYLGVTGRLRAGVSIDQARAELAIIAAQLERQYPADNSHMRVHVGTLRDEISPGTWLMLLVLVAASIGVLLVACTNLANLLLVRALVRRKEVALRAVLGAGRERLARQLLTENLMLAGGGGLLGGLVAWIGLPLLVRLVPNTLPIADTPTLDLRVLAGAALVTIVTGVGFGLLPALRASRSDAAALQEGSRAGVGGRRERLRAVLVVAAIAVSAMLSISSGLLIRALWRLQAIDPGFQAEHVLTLRTSLPMPAYEQTARRERFYARVLSGVRALPGVTNVGYTSFLPIVVRGGVFAVTVEGESLKESAARKVSLRFITPGFFEALRIPLRRGRDVVASDTGTAPLTAIVSESFVRQHWPDRDPIGQRVLIADQMRTVVGVVGDVRVRGRETTSEPQVYAPSAQMVDGLRVWYAPKDLVIRSTAETSALLPAIRAIIAGAEPAQPISDVRTMTDILDEETASRVAQARVLSLFDAVTFLLAAVGIHGLLSFAVSHRSQEIGVRMALGAQARDILRMVLGQSLLMATIGITLGVALAYLVARSLQTLLLGLSPADPLTFSVGIIVALAMTLAGSTAPALRAIHVDPMSAMRAE